MEKRTHLILKALAKQELEHHGYDVYVEPDTSPIPTLHWLAYRPDILGYNVEGSVEWIVLVECETNPTLASVGEKRRKAMGISLQSRLDTSHVTTPVLVVPQGKLSSVVKFGARKFWEIWLVNPRFHEIVWRIERLSS